MRRGTCNGRRGRNGLNVIGLERPQFQHLRFENHRSSHQVLRGQGLPSVRPRRHTDTASCDAQREQSWPVRANRDHAAIKEAAQPQGGPRTKSQLPGFLRAAMIISGAPSDLGYFRQLKLLLYLDRRLCLWHTAD
jgi:hypothetical protein